jgi:hypothetical protein
MAWHIFKKDFKLSWQFALAVALVSWLTAFVYSRLGHFAENHVLTSLLDLLAVVRAMGSGFLIAYVVQHDSLPGVRQDWLIRPIRRRDLLAAKLLFVILLVQGPVFVGDLAGGLAEGFSFSSCFMAALSRSVYLFLGFDLPVLAFASITRNFSEAVVGGLGLFFLVMFFQVMFFGMNNGSLHPIAATFQTGMAWAPEAMRMAILFFGIAVVLAFQYWGRKTPVSRSLILLIAIICLLTQALPWNAAFAVERAFSSSPALSDSVRIDFDPQSPRYKEPSGIDLNQARVQNAVNLVSGDSIVFIPLRITGLPPHTILFGDRYEARAIGPDGIAIDLGTKINLGYKAAKAEGASQLIYYPLQVQPGVFQRIKDKPLKLEPDYSLSLLEPSASAYIPALNGDARVPGLGWCETGVNEAGTGVEIHCSRPGNGPTCGTAVLENASTGKSNPEGSQCNPDYTPYFGRYVPDTAVTRFSVHLPFRDPSGLAHYPVDGPQLGTSNIKLTLYKAEAHFNRKLTIPNIRLRDWLPE